MFEYCRYTEMLLLGMVHCQLKVDCEDIALVIDLHKQCVLQKILLALLIHSAVYLTFSGMYF